MLSAEMNNDIIEPINVNHHHLRVVQQSFPRRIQAGIVITKKTFIELNKNKTKKININVFQAVFQVPAKN